MMIAGFILTTVLVGRFLDPFSLGRLIEVAAVVTGVALITSVLAVLGVERRAAKFQPDRPRQERIAFKEALSHAWEDGDARGFALFIFVSMLGYSAQDLILEPFAGLVFNYTPGQSTSLSGTQNSGVLLGMILVGVISTWHAGRDGKALRNWTVFGCVGSALALLALVGAAWVGPGWHLEANVFALGLANGVFAVAAIAMMFGAAAGVKSREGIRMGIFGASQAIAFGAGGFCGTVLTDVMKAATGSNALSYGTVFAVDALLFVAAALIAMRIGFHRSMANPFALAAQHDLGRAA
jgi:BCD family chlorophyll transporter-like MFS transporter